MLRDQEVAGSNPVSPTDLRLARALERALTRPSATRVPPSPCLSTAGRVRRASYVPTSKVGAELLFDVVSTAYERTSVVVTTNLPFEQWTEVLGSERLTGAALDRLTHQRRTRS